MSARFARRSRFVAIAIAVGDLGALVLSVLDSGVLHGAQTKSGHACIPPLPANVPHM